MSQWGQTSHMHWPSRKTGFPSGVVKTPSPTRRRSFGRGTKADGKALFGFFAMRSYSARTRGPTTSAYWAFSTGMLRFLLLIQFSLKRSATFRAVRRMSGRDVSAPALTAFSRAASSRSRQPSSVFVAASTASMPKTRPPERSAFRTESSDGESVWLASTVPSAERMITSGA